MSKHTPGPWSRDKYGSIVGPDGKGILFRSMSMLSSGSDELMAIAEANTDLAASVTDLLGALEASNLLLRTQRHACESNEVCRVLDVHISRNNAAIAKAKGESA